MRTYIDNIKELRAVLGKLLGLIEGNVFPTESIKKAIKIIDSDLEHSFVNLITAEESDCPGDELFSKRFGPSILATIVSPVMIIRGCCKQECLLGADDEKQSKIRRFMIKIDALSETLIEAERLEERAWRDNPLLQARLCNKEGDYYAQCKNEYKLAKKEMSPAEVAFAEGKAALEEIIERNRQLHYSHAGNAMVAIVGFKEFLQEKTNELLEHMKVAAELEHPKAMIIYGMALKFGNIIIDSSSDPVCTCSVDKKWLNEQEGSKWLNKAFAHCSENGIDPVYSREFVSALEQHCLQKNDQQVTTGFDTPSAEALII